MINPDDNKEKKYPVPRRNLVQRNNVFIVPALTTLFQRFWGYIYIRRFMKF